MNEKLYDSYIKRLPSSVVNDVCRFCVRKRRRMSTIDQLWLSKLFHRVTQLQLETTADYPQRICTDCEVTLRETAKQISAFQEVDTFWRTYIQRQPKKERQYNMFKKDNFDEYPKGSPIADQVYPIEEIQLGDIIKVEPLDLDAFQPADTAVVNNDCQMEKSLVGEVHSFECNNCGEVFGKKSELKKHMNAYHQYNKCPECEKQFLTSRQLSNHIKRHKKPNVGVDGLFTCTTCNESFKMRIAYRKHLYIQHKETLLHCKKCEITFTTITRLRNHMTQMHASTPSLECDICKKLFHSRKQIVIHMRNHVKPEPYVCEICGYVFKWRSSVVQHQLLHCRKKAKKIVTIKQIGHLPCPLCSRLFKRCVSLRGHLKDKHPEDGRIKWAELMPLMCFKCDKICRSSDEIKYHREMHKAFQCNVCKKNFTCQEAYDFHVKTHSAKERPHACQLCDATYVMRNHLNQHMRSVHTHDRPFSCHLCEKSYTEKYILDKHIRSFHLRERNFSCDKCDKKYHRQYELNIHYQTHTGVYRYQCKICNKNFGNSSMFISHNAHNHPNERT